jgi:16S rRNA (adenine1518-N6/adenine1519-N6)-dimethyltransferase
MEVRAKKHLGQHFLKDLGIAKQIAESLKIKVDNVVEVGPGMGVLTQFLKENTSSKLFVAEIDQESVTYLLENNIVEQSQILGDFLQLDLAATFDQQQVAVIGNFPYNISSQILFKTLEFKHLIPEFAGMFQKEVAQRICSGPGSKDYGILSVLTQAYYHTEYLFTVDEHVFSPPPRIKSGVIRLVRKENLDIGCDEKIFKEVIKLTFNTRRKMLRVSLKTVLGKNEILQDSFFQKRPEQLSVEEFVYIANLVAESRK